MNFNATAHHSRPDGAEPIDPKDLRFFGDVAKPPGVVAKLVGDVAKLKDCVLLYKADRWKNNAR